MTFACSMRSALRSFSRAWPTSNVSAETCAPKYPPQVNYNACLIRLPRWAHFSDAGRQRNDALRHTIGHSVSGQGRTDGQTSSHRRCRTDGRTDRPHQLAQTQSDVLEARRHAVEHLRCDPRESSVVVGDGVARHHQLIQQDLACTTSDRHGNDGALNHTHYQIHSCFEEPVRPFVKGHAVQRRRPPSLPRAKRPLVVRYSTEVHR
jgi:hypothetical protein